MLDLRPHHEFAIGLPANTSIKVHHTLNRSLRFPMNTIHRLMERQPEELSIQKEYITKLQHCDAYGVVNNIYNSLALR